MKKQINRLSPYQNGKVFGILMAIASLFIYVPMVLIISAMGPQIDQYGNEIVFPSALLIAMPVFHAIFGFISVVIGCALYNLLFRYIGGFEFEVIEESS